MSRPPCRYFNTSRGCRQGSACNFSHSESSWTASPASSFALASGRGRQPSTSSHPPSGVCRFFWSSGKCKSEFGCRFKHVKDRPNELATSFGSSERARDSIIPFLTEKGLSKITGNGTDAFFNSANDSLSPNEVHNHLKKFLHDDFRFRKTFDIYAFIALLANVHLSNPAWTSEDGQLLLDRIATGNGILRINDVLLWPSVSTEAGSNSSLLSFQRGYLPLLRFLSSDVVVKSTLGYLVNALYMRIMENFDHFSKNLEACMDVIMSAGTFKDPKAVSSSKEPMASQVIASLSTVFFECLTRFKNASSIYPRLVPMVYRLQTWTEQWIAAVLAPLPTFDAVLKDNERARDHIIAHLKGKIDRLKSIADREQAKADQREQKTASNSLVHVSLQHEGIVTALHTIFEGPGELRSTGPRHDNDFVHIHDIRIPPTHEELISCLPPFLPANLWDAPHHLPAESMERLLDIQFRLLREELTAPLRTSVQLVRADMFNIKKTQLSDLILKYGGKYRSFADTHDSIMFNVYTGVNFVSLVPDRRGLSVNLSFDAPPGRARAAQPKARAVFWEGMNGKRLMQGGLIALVWKRGSDVAVHLGILASPLREISDSARRSADRVSARIVFFDSEVESRILATLKDSSSTQKGLAVLVEAPVMFEAIRPFLEALLVEPEVIPFKQYLVHHPPGYLANCFVAPPKYAQAPGFAFQLGCLFPPEAGISDLKMHISDPVSVTACLHALRQISRLDESQAEAVVDALTREVSLIQGPPGTGKSYTGVELLRVLLQHTRPVLMIAFTNHALDHMLTSVLDAGITKRIVRLGSRSADERIAQFSIEALETVAGQSRLDRTFGGHYRELKTVEERIRELMTKFTQATVTSTDIMQYVQIQYPENYDHIRDPPAWISILKKLSDEEGEGWTRAGRRSKTTADDNSLYAFWLKGSDLDFLDARINRPVIVSYSDPPLSSKETSPENVVLQNKYNLLLDDNSISCDTEYLDEEEELEPWEKKGAWAQDHTPQQQSEIVIPGASLVQVHESEDSIDCPPHLQISDLKDPFLFFESHGYDTIPVVPSSDRPLDILLSDGPMWSMSIIERKRLHTYWTQEVRETNYGNNLDDFRDLRIRHAEVLRKYNEGKNEIRRQLLKDVDIFGCTTTGAAKLGSLLKGLEPRIMLVEEAGQVLEAHILAALVPSIEHLILIGDPLQLRPTLNNYALSMDSKRGNQLFKFDMSLMERLSSSGFPMSQIDVQRRMRPTISNLIRTTLYPRLVDHSLVHEYSDVRGFVKNIFFLNHEHRENGGAVDDSASKYNLYEVNMIKDLVLYLLRQGCYSQEGDIVVLCAYLGQLAKVRDALAGIVAVVIDGRDQEALADQEDAKEDPEYTVEHVKVSQRIRLRTVDNYQGEEAKIVILSLVRNAGATADEMKGQVPSIGFLKSDNRTNVALSRAKEGLFILGNAAQLSYRSRMWQKVIEELEQTDSIGNAIPVACHRHRDEIIFISEPGRLSSLAPDGGCLRPCDVRLNCGHVCPYKCHPDDPDHVAVTCSQHCTKLCIRGHPCTKECAEPCGKCIFPVQDIKLPCGHSCPAVPCHLLENLDRVKCKVVLTKALPACEHSTDMECSQDPTGFICTHQCSGIMGCCGRDCKSRCHDCQVKNPVENNDQRIARKQHVQHPCGKTLYCSHQCSKPCSQDHECVTICKNPCGQQCSHARCTEYCSTPCSPCQEPCTWTCPHHSCPLPCGSVCARLPCDRRCERILQCSHRCPSVCGEDCSIQVCPQCAPPRLRDQVVDLVLGRTLEEIEMDEDTSQDLLITLPNCCHVFTVETLDGVCSLADYYTQSVKDGKWTGLDASHLSSHERKKPPTCPTCRAVVKSPRYGRVFKSANLDILERNVISRMTHQLNAIEQAMDAVNKAQMEGKLNEDIRGISVQSIPGTDQKRINQCSRARKAELKEARLPPAGVETLTPDNKQLFSVSPAVISIWKKVTQPLLKIYSQAAKVASTRSAHIHAWEAAYSFLYQQEMDLASLDPAQAPRRPREHAARIARMKVGQPQPRADKRFVVEAFWISLQIRFILGDLARLWLSKAGSNTAYSPEQCQMWAKYALFILDTCVKDARISFETAKASEGRRQMTRSSLFILRADLERFRTNLEIIRQSGMMANNRNNLADMAQENAKYSARSVADTVRDHISILPDDGQGWIRTNFTGAAETIIEEWYNIAKAIHADVFYQPVSLDDRMSIIKALHFSHTGHFYNCPNGHTYVITECGGAMERSHCPECGAPIGGLGHALDSTNTPAIEFEDLARADGAQRSPWTWGV